MPNEVIKIVQEFKNSKSIDIFGISSFLIKQMIHYIAEPLATCINTCLQSGIYPNQLKCSRKKAIRVISGINSMESCRPKFKNHKIMTIFSQYAYYCLINVKENINNFNLRSNVHSFDTRTKNNIDIPYH
ncbi:hypothetical protein J437_LFUL007402, partial [Ladona fulva]